MKALAHSPLALPFEKALTPSLFLGQIKDAGEHQVRSQIAEQGNRALGLALAGAKFVFDAGAMQVVFEGGIPAGAKLMKVAGKALPALVDGKTGRIIKWGRVASKGRVVASIAANAALIVVEAAHMISGHDNAKRLKKVERGVDTLVHAHRSELKSRLESIYRYSKEILHHDLDKLSEEDRRDLHRQCKPLMELRARWRDDFRHALQQIRSSEPSSFDKFWHWFKFWRKDDLSQTNQTEREQEAFDALEIVQLMHFSLMLQMSLAGASGRMEQFTMLTLRDEVHSWTAVLEFANQRTSQITGTNVPIQFREFISSLEELVAFWSPEKWHNATGTTQEGENPPAPEVVKPNPPAQGWTKSSYAKERGISWQSAAEELEAFRRKGLLARDSKGREVVYTTPKPARHKTRPKAGKGKG